MYLKGYPINVIETASLLDELMERVYALSMDTNALPEKLNTMDEDDLQKLEMVIKTLYDALS